MVRPCLALIAPGNRHMALRRAGTRYIAEIVDGQHISRHRPSVDVLFRSASQNAGSNALGILLTGMGDNGARGLLEMRQAGSRTAAQVEAADAAADRLRQTAELALAFSAAAGDETLNQVSRLERQALDGLGLMENVETRIRTALVVLG